MHDIGHLNLLYVVPQMLSGSLSTKHLDDVLSEQLDSACHLALREALGSDPSVYLVRELTHSIATREGEGTSALAQRIAHSMSQAATQIVTANHEGVIRFADWVSYLAQFIIDLIQDRAIGKWYYEPFSHHIQPTISQTLMSLLEAEYEQIAGLMAHLQSRGQLHLLLRHLDSSIISWLWQLISGNSTLTYRTRNGDLPVAIGDRHEDLLSMMLIAIAVAEVLDIWNGPSEVGREALRTVTRDAGASERSLNDGPRRAAIQWIRERQREYQGAGGYVQSWKSPKQAANSLLYILEFLSQKGFLSNVTDSPPSTKRSEGLQEAWEFLSWADRSVLESGLSRLIGRGTETGENSSGIRDDASIGLAESAEAKSLAALAEDLVLALQNVSRKFDSDSATMRILIYSYLTSSQPAVSDSISLSRVVELVMGLLKPPGFSNISPQLFQALRHRDVQGSLQLVPSSAFSPSHQRTLRVWAAAAPQLSDSTWRGLSQAINAIASTSQGDVATASTYWSESPGAMLLSNPRLFLLVRTMLDMNLFGAVKRADTSDVQRIHETFSGVLGGLICHMTNAFLPHEIELLCGERFASLYALNLSIGEYDRTYWHDLQTAILRTLILQRTVSPSPDIFIAEERFENGVRILLGTGKNKSWMMGRWCDAEDDITGAIVELTQAWRDICNLEEVNIQATEFVSQHILDDSRLDILDSEGDPPNISDLLWWDELPNSDAWITVSLLAQYLLSAWSRWLSGFSNSSASYLLSNFLEGKGRLQTLGESYLVTLQPRPHDVVLRLNDYFDEIESVPWLKERSLVFRVEE